MGRILKCPFTDPHNCRLHFPLSVANDLKKIEIASDACSASDSGIYCNMEGSCLDTYQTVQNNACLIPSLGMEISCYNFHTEPFCDENFLFNPTSAKTVWAVLITLVTLSLLHVAADFILWRSRKRNESENRKGLERQAMIRSQNNREQPKLEEQRSSTSASTEGLNSNTIEALGMKGQSKQWIPSSEWFEHMRHFIESKISRSTFPYALLRLFAVCGLITTLLYLSIGQSDTSTVYSVNAVDSLVLIDICYEFLLLLIACLISSWPCEPIFATHVMRRLKDLILFSERGSAASQNSSQGRRFMSAMSEAASVTGSEDTFIAESELGMSLSRDTLLVITAHFSCLTQSRESNLLQCIGSALQLFPPGRVIVLDRGASLEPQDYTQKVVKGIHPGIRYIYVPVESQTAAVHWLNTNWLEKLVPRFLLVIDDKIFLPPNLHLPQELLRRDSGVVGVTFAETVYGGFRGVGLIGRISNVCFRLNEMIRGMESMILGANVQGGRVGFWDRQALAELVCGSVEAGPVREPVTQSPDTLTPSIGIQGLPNSSESRKHDYQPVQEFPEISSFPLLALTRKGKRVQRWSQTLVPSKESDSEGLSVLSTIFEIFSPWSFICRNRLLAKPFLLRILLNKSGKWIRFFWLAGLGVRNFGVLGFLFLFIFGIFLIEICMLLLFLRKRADLRPGFIEILCFPVWKFFSEYVSVLKEFGGLLGRDGFIDLMISTVPPAIDNKCEIDWSTVWQLKPFV